ncbi:MAG: efflux RND transporter periplasmic adaptor subunit [Candidatus Staskawiczbacteria bacterium]|nr:efflux RND transporter periplasmic adaptor subunit [Candidatus Staskawiczbacteria bacterium]
MNKLWLNKIKTLILTHKIISGIIIIVLVIAGYFAYGAIFPKKTTTTYVSSAIAKGTITTFISGSGQVAALDQIDISSKTSGKLIYLNVQKDSEVKAGTLLAQIDSRDAQKAVQSAQNDLTGAQLSTTDVKGNATDALDISHDNGLSALANTFKDLTTIKTNLDSAFLDSSYGGKDSDMNLYLSIVKFYTDNSSDLNYWASDAEKKYSDMETKINTIEEAGWLLNKNSESSKIESSISDTYTSTQNFLDLIRQAFNITQKYQKILISENLSTRIKSDTTATQITNLSSAISSLSTDTSALLTAKTDISAKKITFSKISVDTQAQNLNITQYQNALIDAQQTLANYSMYAKVDGTIATNDSKIRVGDTISSGTVLGSIVTKQEVIEVSFNEVDAVKIKTGQKAIIAFDALPDITATGKVVDIDSVGTTSQGVVSYGAKIGLDVTDIQVKPGMSASVEIITDAKQDVLTVPNSAIKTQGGQKYVQVLVDNIPQQKPVTTGLSNDTSTEIISGLNEGDNVVTQTVTSTSAAKTTSTSSSVRIPGITGGGGANFGR